MTWDISGAKVFLGLPAAVDPVLDPKLQAGLDTALALAETYCNRRFAYAAETVAFTHIRSGVLQLSRYPIEQVSNVANDSGSINTNSYHFIGGTGQIIFDGYQGGHQVSVTYAGGYKVLPADLLLALWRIFDSIWASTPAGGSGGAVSGQAINSITIPDVGTIRYESSGAAGSSSAGAAGGLIDSVAASILSLYRLEIC